MRVPWNWPKPEPMTANFAAMSDAGAVGVGAHTPGEVSLGAADAATVQHDLRRCWAAPVASLLSDDRPVVGQYLPSRPPLA